MPSSSNIVNVSLTLTGANVGSRTDFGSLCGFFVHTEADTFAGPFSSLAALEDAFNPTTYPAIAAWGAAVFSQPVTPKSVYIGKIVTTVALALPAVQAAALALGKDFLFFTISGRTEADIDVAAAWALAAGWTHPKFFVAQSSDADLLTTASGNVAAELKALGNNRVALAYHANNAEYLDGSLASYLGGVAWDTVGGAGQLTFASAPNITPDALDDTQFTFARDSGANVYSSFDGSIGAYPGQTCQGLSVANAISAIWCVVRMREAVTFTLFNSPPKIAYTNAGIARVANSAQTLLTRGVAIGHISPDVPALVTAPAVADVDPADKSAGLLRLGASFGLAGSIIAVNITMTASI